MHYKYIKWIMSRNKLRKQIVHLNSCDWKSSKYIHKINKTKLSNVYFLYAFYQEYKQKIRTFLISLFLLTTFYFNTTLLQKNWTDFPYQRKDCLSVLVTYLFLHSVEKNFYIRFFILLLYSTQCHPPFVTTITFLMTNTITIIILLLSSLLC